MGFLIITIDPSPDSLRRAIYRGFGEALQERGHDCHSMSHTWILRTDDSAEELARYMEDHGLVDPRDSYLVAPLSGDWFGRGCRLRNDCYRESPS